MANTFPMATIWSKRLLKNFDENAVMAGLVNRDYEGDIKNYGDTVKATQAGDITISNYTPGSDMSVQNLTMTDYSMSIDQKKSFNFVIDKTEQAQSHHDLKKIHINRAGVAMTNTVDDRLLGHYANVDSGNVIGSDGSPITLTKDNVYEYFVYASELLDADAQDDAQRNAVVDETTKSLLLQCPQLTHATQMGDNVIKKGMVGEMAGFKIYMTPRLNAVSSVKNLMFFTRDFITLAFQIPAGYIKEYDPPNQHGTGVKGLALYGSKVFHTTSGVVLKKAA